MFNEIYWATRLCQIHEICDILIFVSLLFFGIYSFYYFVYVSAHCSDKLPKSLHIIGASSVISLLLCMVLFIFTPSRTDMALIYGWEALKSEKAEQVYQVIMKQIGQP